MLQQVKQPIQFIVSFLFMVSLTSCSIKKYADVYYGSKLQSVTTHSTLSIFTDRNETDIAKPVLIFVYGGNWNSGRKELYNYVGRNFSKHDMVVVMPDYVKSPKVSYKEMATQIATSIQWVKDNIADYGGNPDRIFLTGHSAGGHLVALATLNPEFGVDQKDIKGIILNDAAGLDMETYLKNNPPTTSDDYLTTWTNNPAEWKNASPINFLNANTPKIKMYTGRKTYKSIISSNDRFLKELQKYQPEASIQWLDKRHIPMVAQLFWPWSDRFEEVATFIHQN